MAFLKKKLDKNEWVGVILTVIGVTIVGFAGFVNDKKASSSRYILIGIFI